MKLLTCPVNGSRPVSEFVYGGEMRQQPDPDSCSDEQWSDYVFNRTGIAAVKREWWCHGPSGVWFLAERDTATDAVIRTFLWPDAELHK